MENIFVNIYFKLKKHGHNYRVMLIVKAFSNAKE